VRGAFESLAPPAQIHRAKKEILIATRNPVKLNLDRRTSGTKTKHSRRSPPPTVRIRPDAKRVNRRLPVSDRPVSAKPVANAAPTSVGQSSASPDTPRDLSCTSRRRLGATARIGPRPGGPKKAISRSIAARSPRTDSPPTRPFESSLFHFPARPHPCVHRSGAERICRAIAVVSDCAHRSVCRTDAILVTPSRAKAPQVTDKEGLYRCQMRTARGWTDDVHHRPEGYDEVDAEGQTFDVPEEGTVNRTFYLRKQVKEESKAE
jgi:hypothetical protein